MKCEKCGKSPSDGHTALFRQNAKGEIGRWRCTRCNDLPVDPEVAEIVGIIQGAAPVASPKAPAERDSEGPSLLPGDPGQDEQGESQ